MKELKLLVNETDIGSVLKNKLFRVLFSILVAMSVVTGSLVYFANLPVDVSSEVSAEEIAFIQELGLTPVELKATGIDKIGKEIVYQYNWDN